MSTDTVNEKITMKDLKTEDPRWCTGCGDYTILVGIRKFMVNHQLQPKDTVNISGIGCSGRIPHYLNTYGLHGIHGRAMPLATGLILARPDLQVLIHSGDGDSLSIGGNHLIHGIHKNVNCVYLLFDNQIYGLTKNQTSPTSQQGLKTASQPKGSYLEPINPIKFALGLGCGFVASTAEWLGNHFVDTVERAYAHKGFSFVHIAQRCPKFNPDAWEFKDSSWITFIENEERGVMAEKRTPEAKKADHDPTDYGKACEFAENVPSVFGVFYQREKAIYDSIVQENLKSVEKKDKSSILKSFRI